MALKNIPDKDGIYAERLRDALPAWLEKLGISVKPLSANVLKIDPRSLPNFLDGGQGEPPRRMEERWESAMKPYLENIGRSHEYKTLLEIASLSKLGKRAALRKWKATVTRLSSVQEAQGDDLKVEKSDDGTTDEAQIPVDRSRVCEYDHTHPLILPSDESDQKRMIKLEECPVSDQFFLDDHADLQSILHKMSKGAKPILLRMTNDSMAPTYPAGTKLVVDLNTNEIGDGGVYVFIEDDQFRIRWIEPVAGGMVEIYPLRTPLNRRTEPRDSIVVCGAIFDIWEPPVTESSD